MGLLGRLWLRELGRAWGRGGGAAGPAAFFLSACALAAFAIGADAETLSKAGVGVVVIAFALAAILGLEHLFQGDLESGALEQTALGPAALEMLAGLKILARAIATLWPVALISPVAGIVLGLPTAGLVTLLVGGLIAAPGLVGGGAAAAALAAGRARGGLLIAVISPPLLAPPVIFFAGAVSAAGAGEDPTGALLLLGAATLFSLVVGAFGAGAALRMHLE